MGLICVLLATLFGADSARGQVNFGPSQNYTITNNSTNLLRVLEARAFYTTDLTYQFFFEEIHHYGFVLDNGMVTTGIDIDAPPMSFMGMFVSLVPFSQLIPYPVDTDGDGVADSMFYDPPGIQPGGTLELAYWDWYDYDYGVGDRYHYSYFIVDLSYEPFPPGGCANTTNVIPQCGVLANPGTLSWAHFQVCAGGSAPTPTMTGIDITPGSLQTVISNCVAGTLTTNASPITYSIGELTFSPQIPASFPNPGSNTFDATIVLTPSDTNCPPISYSLPFTVEVVTTSATNVTVNCGGLLTPGSFGSTNLQVCINSPISVPTGDPPTFSNGEVITEIVDCTTGATNRSTNVITYTVGANYFDPSPPASFPAPTNFTATVKVDATPSDNRCSVINETLGALSIMVVTNSTTNVFCASPGAMINSGVLSATNIMACVGDPMPVPTLSAASFSNGEMRTEIVDCAAGTTNITITPVTYSSTLKFSPTYPTNGLAAAGTHPILAYSVGVPSTHVCPPISVFLGIIFVTAGDITTNEVVQCGSVSAAGSVSPNNVQACVNGSISNAISGFSFNSPSFGDGVITRTIYDCATGSSTVTTSPIGYTPGSIYFQPPFPATFPAVGNYAFTAKQTASSSDPRCGDLTATLGTVNVQVVDTSATNVYCAAQGSLASPGTLNSTNLSACLYGTVAPPSINGLTFNPGSLETRVVDCASGNVTLTVTPVGYNAGAVTIVPPIPAAFTNIGPHSFTVNVTGLPDDPRCSPVVAAVGSFTVHVGDSITNIFKMCGGVSDSGGLTPSAVEICLNGSLPAPAHLPATFTDGSIRTEVVDCFTGETNVTVETVSYTAGGLYLDPAPTGFTNLGTFNFSAKMDGISSDPRCPKLTATLGTLQVTVKNDFTTNVLFQCGGSVLTPGALAVTNAQACPDGSVGAPFAAAPTFEDGSIVTNVVDCATGVTNTTAGPPITYTAGGLYFVPPIPAIFTNLGVHDFAAFMDAIPSHPNCPANPVSLGNFSVEVVDTSSTNTTFNCGSVTNATALQFTNIICVLESATPPAITNDFFSAAEAITNIVDCLTGMTNRTTNFMQYTKTVRFVPPVPTNGFPNPGTFPFEIHVDGASPTVACPDLTAHAGTFHVVVSKVDIVETNVFACVNEPATFNVTPDSSTPIYWSISPDNGGNGAFFPNGNTGQMVTINAGPDPDTYTVTAHDQWTNCMDTATLTVQRLRLALASTNVFVNMDDDNGNGINDVDELLVGPTSQVAGENNLVELTLTTENFTSPNQTVTLTVPGNVRLWENSDRGPGAPVAVLNWPANAVPASFWVEGVDASAAIASSQFVLTLTGGCSVNTNFTVIDVDTVLFKAIHSPLTPNTNPGGGLTLFPGRPTVQSTNDYSQVMVEATLKPPMPGVRVYFRSIDVDDPSSGHAPPLDDENLDLDNKVAAADRHGKLSGGGSTYSIPAGYNGVAWVVFHTTMQPGDNFRVIASPIAEFRNHYQAVQTHATGGIGLIGDPTNLIPVIYTTPMLTVWRRLHVEVDSMEAVPVLANTVMGSITQIFGTQAGGATQAVLNVSLVNGLAPTDNSNNLDSNPPRNGRFENGTALIGQSPNLAVTQGLLGNGASFVRMPNGGAFDIPFTIVNSNGTVTLNGQIYAMPPGANDALFFVSPSLTSAAFDNGTITVAGHAFAVDVNTPTSVRTTIVAPVPTLDFTVADDDINTLLPGNSQLGVLTAALADAYIAVLDDEGGTPGNNQTDATFVLNVPNTYKGDLEESFERQAIGLDDYWVAYLLISYQYTTLHDHDPYPGGGAVGGVCWCHSSNTAVTTGGDGTQIFVETIRDRLANGATAGLDPRVTAHEIGHQLGLSHWDSDEPGAPLRPPAVPYPQNYVPNNLMKRSQENVPNADARFVQQHLHLIRSRVQTPHF